MNEIISENDLTPSDIEERDFHEENVDAAIKGIGELAKIGDASLKVLRDKRLYRITHKTFEEYCQERFGITRVRVHQRIAFGGMLDGLLTRVNTLPATEYQARSLLKLPTPDLQSEAWTNAQAATGKEQPSSSEVDEQVKALQCRLSEIQSSLEITEQGKEEWRVQAIKEKKAKTEAEQKAQIAQGEAATLRRTLAAEADKLAEAKILETKLEVSHAKEEAAKLKESIKALKRERRLRQEGAKP